MASDREQRDPETRSELNSLAALYAAQAGYDAQIAECLAYLYDTTNLRDLASERFRTAHTQAVDKESLDELWAKMEAVGKSVTEANQKLMRLKVERAKIAGRVIFFFEPEPEHARSRSLDEELTPDD